MTATATLSTRGRVGFIDQWRGFMIIGVVIYHTLFDITMIFEKNLSWFTNPYVFTGAPWILAGSFMLISGISCHYSKNNLKRGIQTICIALAMMVITLFFIPDLTIKFGILHLMGSCMLIYCLVWWLFGKLNPAMGIIISLVLFLLTFNIYYRGTIGIMGIWEYHIPQNFYSTDWGFVFGLPKKDFVSGDYYPLLPWSFLFFTGAYWGEIIKKGHEPKWFYKSRKGVLTWVGKRTMAIYLAHQPLIYGILYLIFGLAKA